MLSIPPKTAPNLTGPDVLADVRIASRSYTSSLKPTLLTGRFGSGTNRASVPKVVNLVLEKNSVDLGHNI